MTVGGDSVAVALSSPCLLTEEGFPTRVHSRWLGHQPEREATGDRAPHGARVGLPRGACLRKVQKLAFLFPRFARWGLPMIDNVPRQSSSDATDHERIEAALLESEARYQAISELTSTYAYLTRLGSDGSLVLEWVAGDFVQITGYTLDEIKKLGGPIRLTHPTDRPVVVKRTERLLSGQPNIS